MSSASTPADPNDWPLTGRDASGTHYSRLDQLNARTVGTLGFAWQYRVGGFRNLQATPVVAAGSMYVTSGWGAVYALDAVSGRLRWRFDPDPGRESALHRGVDVANRGVALWHEQLFVLAYDCRLFAIDTRDGRVIWSVGTAPGPKYTCTGAPVVANRVVVVGSGGSDLLGGGLRGYVSAYDVESGALGWRTYTVPNRVERDAAPELAAAEATWSPTRDPHFGGGGTVWDAIVYDPDLDRLYVGTGNAAPYLSARELGGRPLDRLYAASILALDTHSGRIVWHYQTTPGDVWDFDATSPLVCADLPIAGRPRRVLLQANKNGIFYVIDRMTGQPITAAPIAFVNWTTGLDKHFRPIVPASAAAPLRAHYPGTMGAHTWEPMSFSPRTGLVYVPVVDTQLRSSRWHADCSGPSRP